MSADGVEPGLTETIALRNADASVAPLIAMRKPGMNMAFDDSGTGYASLASVRQCPVNPIEIDRSFVAGIETGCDAAAAISDTTLMLGRGLGLGVVAEGVET